MLLLVLLCAVPYCTVLGIVLLFVVCCLVSGKCVVGICRLLQWRHGTADICRTGSMASLLVLGTIQVLPRRWIMLLLKSCLMLLSQINVVPPMAV